MERAHHPYDRWRFNTLHRFEAKGSHWPAPISSRVLTRTLKQLERDGLISRKVFAVVPPRVEYSLTGLGERFLNFAREILDWTVESRADFEVARAIFEASSAVPLVASRDL